ncbi:MAG: DUF1837 domain-containing protein, partial [Acidobacteria bacterium]|nr:DUF1837 domain-containing protein [Acidobacteriota bacterium]MCI0723238.1 DUF1837 domain-containing protein [Acidobacteriota bacterium]
MSTITRENFDQYWFKQRAAGQGQTSYQSIGLEEIKNVRPKVELPLLEAIYDHHIHPDRLKGVLQRLGYEKAAAALIEQLPKNDQTRKGNFGEVVASEHLRQRYGLEMPVFKLRYSDNPAMPLRGEDIIAFELDRDSRIVTVCIGEAKVRTSHSAAEVRNAHKRLHTAYHPYPVALSLISSVLHDQGSHSLADQVDSLMDRSVSRPRRNWIFLITEGSTDSPFSTLDEGKVVENLSCVHLQLSDLTNKILCRVSPRRDLAENWDGSSASIRQRIRWT